MAEPPAVGEREYVQRYGSGKHKALIEPEPVPATVTWLPGYRREGRHGR